MGHECETLRNVRIGPGGAFLVALAEAFGRILTEMRFAASVLMLAKVPAAWHAAVKACCSLVCPVPAISRSETDAQGTTARENAVEAAVPGAGLQVPVTHSVRRSTTQARLPAARRERGGQAKVFYCFCEA